MFAITFDLQISALKEHYPKDSYTSAYTDIAKIMRESGFKWIEGSVYAYNKGNDAMLAVTRVVSKLKKLKWFCEAVKDIRVFQILEWSNYTEYFKEGD